MTQDLFSVGGKKGKVKSSCHESHKELKFGKGILVGASCWYPRSGYDIYIGLDYGMSFEHDVYPWEDEEDSVIEFQFRITDMSAPKSPKNFKKMITWVCNQLHDGKKIHVGCIGGHGRTGLFIAALRAEFDGDKSATTWTRKHHCKKSVESKTQINFLFKHYGVKKVKPSKSDYKGWVDKTGKFEKYLGTSKGQNVIPFTGPTGTKKLKHVVGKGSIWG